MGSEQTAREALDEALVKGGFQNPKLQPLDLHIDVVAARSLVIPGSPSAVVVLKGTPGQLDPKLVGSRDRPRLRVRFDVILGGGPDDGTVVVDPGDVELQDVDDAALEPLGQRFAPLEALRPAKKKGK